MPNKKLPPQTFEKVKLLHEQGKSNQEICKNLNLKYGTLTDYMSAINHGCSSHIEYLNQKAKRKGFPSFVKYNAYRRQVRRWANSKPSTQEKFEKSIDSLEKDNLENISIAQNSKIKSDVYDMLDQLEKIKGRISRNIVEAYYFEGKTLEELGSKFRLTKEGVRQIKNKALGSLCAIAKEEFEEYVN